MLIHNTTIEVVHGSVLDQDVQAIVNAANTMMRGGGGIDGAIHTAAGPELLQELRKVAPNGAPTGTAVATPAFRLKHRWIIHTPGPVWRGGAAGEHALLASSYRSSLEAASSLGAKSIGFCSISTGIYGFPIEEAAPLAITTATEFLTEAEHQLERVVFAMYSMREYEAFEAALRAATEQQQQSQ
jgi:O-acetyl-ADP-ribose deacetylase (regulator of RNase III)